MSSEPITPWIVKQYFYCPIIPWIVRNYGVTEPPTESMREGKNLTYEEKIRRLRRAGIKGKIELETTLKSTKYNVQGKIDAIAREGGETIVVEIKAYKDKRVLRHKMQLLTYTLLAQDNMGPIHQAILILGEKKLKYTISYEELKMLKRVLERIRETISCEKPPRTVKGRKCYSCWYSRLCPEYE